MRFLTLVIVSSTLVAIAGAAPFSENFENAEVGKLPSGFTAYAGAFKVNEEMGRKFLELPGAPLDTFGVLFGPALQSADTAANRISASGKFYATSVKRKAPAFGIRPWRRWRIPLARSARRKGPWRCSKGMRLARMLRFSGRAGRGHRCGSNFGNQAASG
jgi:hypothetical protein